MPEALHPVPACTKVGNWWRCPQSDFKSLNPAMESLTAGTLLGASIRLVGGYDPATKTWNRTFQAYQITEGGPELGFAHMAHRNTRQKLVGNAGQVVSDVARYVPDLAQQAWGAEAANLVSESYVNNILDSERGGHKSQNDWFLAGWNWIMQQPAAQGVYTRRWFDDIARPAIEWSQRAGVSDARTVAAAIRMRNSSGAWLQKLKDAVARLGEGPGRDFALAEYGKPDRTEKINTWPEFQGSVPPYPDTADLGFPSSGTATAGRTPEPPGPGGPTVPVGVAPAIPPIPGVGAWATMSPTAKIVAGVVGAAIVGLGGFGVYRLVTKKKKKKKGRKKRR
jgi:hypothetical protein